MDNGTTTETKKQRQKSIITKQTKRFNNTQRHNANKQFRKPDRTNDSHEHSRQRTAEIQKDTAA